LHDGISMDCTPQLPNQAIGNAPIEGTSASKKKFKFVDRYKFGLWCSVLCFLHVRCCLSFLAARTHMQSTVLTASMMTPLQLASHAKEFMDYSSWPICWCDAGYRSTAEYSPYAIDRSLNSVVLAAAG
jgi:hypothetical protein